MRTVLRNGQVWRGGKFVRETLVVENGILSAAVSAEINRDICADRNLDLHGFAVFPGFVDVHVHLREPGFSYKETIATGSAACARGGYTTVCAMPNLNPAPDSPDHLAEEERLIREQAVIRVLPYAAITVGQRGEGELVDFSALAGRVCGFSDDGRGVKTLALMREAMRRCRAADSLIAAHCEDLTVIPAGAGVHEGAYARRHGLPGIPSASEWQQIRRDIALCRETGCRYHVCHVSTRESVALIRQARREGVDITCETAPHYLLLSEKDLPEDPSAPDSGRFKMNPPLRAEEDRQALVEGLLDGTIDIIATDHAPHSAQEKQRGLTGSAMGIVGIETAFPLLYTHLVETGIVPLSLLVDRLTDAPRRRFRLDGGLSVGQRAELCVWDLQTSGRVDPAEFRSMGRATPFAGWPVHAACRLTMVGDRIAFAAGEETA